MKKKYSVIFPLFLIVFNTFAQQKYFQQHTDFQIVARLDDRLHQLAGSWAMTYQNNSPDALPFIYMHLWANAFSSRSSAYVQQQLRQDKTDFYFADESLMGGFSNLKWTSDGKPLEVEIDKKNPDIIKIKLPTPLSSGAKIRLETPFSLQIPKDFSRIGRKRQTDNSFAYYLTQWFPKPAVYDAKGWHKMPYLDQGEFYAEFGRYDVRLTVPSDYIVAATGTLQTPSERAWLLQKANPSGIQRLQNSGINNEKTLHYVADSVVDFAWFAAKNFAVRRDEATLQSGKKVETWAFFPPEEIRKWHVAATKVRQAIEFYSAEVGEYPFGQATAVCGGSFGGGMEYPMITLVGGGTDSKTMDITIAHEVGHNWFQGILASNERDFPFLDEGLNTFFERRYTEKHYTQMAQNEHKFGDLLRGGDNAMGDLIEHDVCYHRCGVHSAMNSDSMGASLHYFAFAYHRPARLLLLLEKHLGREKFDRAMKAYFQKWKFKHPQPEDLRAVFEAETGENLATFFNHLFYGEKPESNFLKIQPPIIKPLGIGEYKNRMDINVYPALAFNEYDGVMLGLAFSNQSLAAKSFRWAIAPMYGFRSRDVVGTGIVQQDFFIKNNKLTLDIGWKNFHFDKLNNINETLNYQRFTPSVTWHFAQDAISTWEKKLTFRWLHIQKDTIGYRNATEYSIGKDQTNIQELAFVANRQHGLGNSLIKIALENQHYTFLNEAQNYLRLAVQGEQELAYRNKKKVAFRIFGGYFLQNTGRARGNFFGGRSRGSFSVVGNGASDYRFDDIWYGRNFVESKASRQISPLTEGGMRLALDPRHNVGFSNDFAMTLSITADFPMQLPSWLPLKAYYDLGYFNDTRPVGEDKANQRLQNLGIMLDGKFVRMYFPIWYAPERLRNIMSARGNYWQRVSFSVDFQKVKFWNWRKMVSGLM